MNKSKYVIPFLLIILTASLLYPQQKFIVDLSDTAGHTFNVTLYPEQLTDKNKIYQFAAAVPGTYEIMDVGRFVRSFHAFDNSDKEIPTKQISTNQWEIFTPTQTKKLEYSVSDTWHPNTTSHAIYLMSGTNLEKDNALINPHCLLGYFEGMQSVPVYIKINHPDSWQTGTALTQNNEGFYTADSYDRVVDSPFLLGNLSESETNIGRCVIKIYTYSKTEMVKSSDILSSVTDILNAEDKFMDGLPVDHYTFLFHFADVANGAWEHSYSSEYVLKELPLEELLQGSLRTYISHEFFHIITPLNIHSQLIEPFNFVNPVMSQHLWFYEGTTEWAAWILQLRAGLMSLDDYIQGIKRQLITSEYFKKDLSLRDLSINAYKYPDQYQNIYMKGPVTAALLDVYILKLSDGKKGLREVILDLSKKYGVHKSFDEDTFFDEIVKMTYPEIKTFIDKYIIHNEPLPLKEYFGWLGIDYEKSKGVDSTKIELGFGVSLANNRIVIADVPDTSNTEMRTGDIINKLYDNPITLENAQEAFMVLRGKKPGDEIKLVLTRDGKDFDVLWKLPPAQKKHYFEISSSPTPEHLALRDVWLKNLPQK
jgi:predicted metalloprotease with PDZ domain